MITAGWMIASKLKRGKFGLTVAEDSRFDFETSQWNDGFDEYSGALNSDHSSGQAEFIRGIWCDANKKIGRSGV